MDISVLLSPDFVSIFSAVSRAILFIVLLIPLVAIVLELKARDELNTLRYLIIGFISSFMLGRLSLGLFQVSKIISDIPEWLSLAATLVASTSDLAMAACVLLMAVYFRRRIKRLKLGIAYNAAMSENKIISVLIIISIIVIVFFLGIIAFFSVATYRNVTAQGVAINEIYTVLINGTTTEEWE